MIIFKKRIIVVIATFALLSINMSFSAYAQNKTIKAEGSVKVVSIREDVPSYIARKDKTYNGVEANAYYSKNSVMAQNNENVRWDIAGERLFNDKEHLIAAYGYSAHMKDNTVLNTYHYTRVYFGRSKSGDSGRVWGRGKVYATGPWTDWTEVTYNTLYVKYGTE